MLEYNGDTPTVTLVNERFQLTPFQYWLFTPELQWQSRG